MDKTEHLHVATQIRYQDGELPAIEAVIALYRDLEWSSADRPRELAGALAGSHGLITAWHGARLVGLANAISDGHLVVYYPHLAVHPEYQRRGIGRELMARLARRYEGFHQHALLADGRAVGFYEKCGFTRAGGCEPMWIYHGKDHG